MAVAVLQPRDTFETALARIQKPPKRRPLHLERWALQLKDSVFAARVAEADLSAARSKELDAHDESVLVQRLAAAVGQPADQLHALLRRQANVEQALIRGRAEGHLSEQTQQQIAQAQQALHATMVGVAHGLNDQLRATRTAAEVAASLPRGARIEHLTLQQYQDHSQHHHGNVFVDSRNMQRVYTPSSTT